jgi:hypothetical protein
MTSQTYQVVAYNYAHDSENKIHDDETAARYGFKGGLVPGVADYGYLSRAALQTWGEAWMRGGSMEAKFIKPIYHGEMATAIASSDDDPNHLTLSLQNPDGVSCAVGQAHLRCGVQTPRISDYPHHAPLAPSERALPAIETFTPGRTLGAIDYTHDTQQARDLSQSLFVEALPCTDGQEIWHPALCLSYANQIVKANLQLGAWVHTASHVDYFDQPRQGEQLSLRGSVAATYDKRGHVVTELDLAMFADAQRALVKIRHSAIIRLASE